MDGKKHGGANSADFGSSDRLAEDRAECSTTLPPWLTCGVIVNMLKCIVL